MDPVIPDDEAGPTPTVIVLDHVSKRFTDFVAVDDADFAIGRASSSRCWARRAAARPPCCG